MTVKEELHRLIEELPEEKIGQARNYLQSLKESEMPEERAARVRSGFGALAQVPGSVDDLLVEKHEENEGEEGRQERVSALGKFAQLPISSEAYYRRKHEDRDREEEQAERLRRGEG
ncbi:MAG: hypothetical protein KY468_08220 [Armatimonadetes bacterium]|nr:hypothetical protein [Armatimonadota bacterium]